MKPYAGILVLCNMLVAAALADAQEIWRPDGAGSIIPAYPVPPAAWQDRAVAVKRVLRVYPNRNGVVLLNDPRNASSVLAGRQLGFMSEPYFVAAKHTTAQTEFFLLATVGNTAVQPLKADEFIGWVDSRSCLEYWHGDVPEALKSPRTQILRKCMLVNSFQDIKAKSPEELKAQVSFFDRPGVDGRKPLTQRALFEVYYVYDMVASGDVELTGFIRQESDRDRVKHEALEILQREVKNGNLPGPFLQVDTRRLQIVRVPPGASSTDDISLRIQESVAEKIPGALITGAALQREFLLGDEPVFRSPHQIIGWVPYNRLCEWNTIECMEIRKDNAAKRKREARAFASRDELTAYLKKLELTTDDPVDQPIATEKKDSGEWDYSQPRWPLVSDLDEKYQGTTIVGIPTYKIGFIGDVFKAGQIVVQGADVAAAREKANKLIAEVSTIQVMFVIDATYSMDDWYDGVIDAVNGVMRAAQQVSSADYEIQVEFSMNFFRDFGGEHKVVENFPFTNDAFEANSIVKNQKQRCLGGKGDGGEALYFGISEAVKNGDFNPNSVKLVILVGDDGNRPGVKGSVDECVSEFDKKVGGAFPIGFYAVGVNDPAEQKRRDEHQNFIADAGKLAEALKKRESERFSQLSSDPKLVKLASELSALQSIVTKGGGTDLAAAISNRFQLALVEVNKALDLLDRLKRGEMLENPDSSPPSENIAARYGMVVEERLEKLIKDEGLEPLQLARGGVQLFQKGWIAARDPHDSSGEEAFRTMALAHKSALRSQVTLLDELTRAWDPEQLEKSWVSALTTVKGEKINLDKKQSPAELMQQHTGIVVKHSGLLKLSFEELQTVGTPQLNELFGEISYYMERMEDVMDGYEGTYGSGKRITPKGTEIQRNDVRLSRAERDWWWGVNPQDDVRGHNLRCWMPREYLP